MKKITTEKMKIIQNVTFNLKKVEILRKFVEEKGPILKKIRKGRALLHITIDNRVIETIGTEGCGICTLESMVQGL